MAFIYMQKKMECHNLILDSFSFHLIFQFKLRLDNHYRDLRMFIVIKIAFPLVYCNKKTFLF
jgi:hypothetical protein